MSNYSQTRIPEIEGIRGILSILVLVGHIKFSLIPWFWGCMDVFFCISGFLITRIVLNNQWDFNFLKIYFFRRVIRIWPMYYTGMLFAYLLALIIGFIKVADPILGWSPKWMEILLPLIFLQNTEKIFGYDFKYLSFFNHSWSVAIEEQYYVIWPFVIYFVLKYLGARSIIALGIGAIMMSLLLREQISFWLLVCRLDGFILGALLAGIELKVVGRLYKRSKLVVIFKYLWLWPFLALIPYISESYCIFTPKPNLIWKLASFTILNPYFNFALLGFCIIGKYVFAEVENVDAKILKLPWMQYLGAMSYSTYIMHFPLVIIVTPYITVHWHFSALAAGTLSLFLSLGVAHLTHKYIELKAMGLKKYYPYQLG